MEATMKNIFKKLALIIATAAVIFAGAANVYASLDHWPSIGSQEKYQRFLDIETGN
jgi:hypothetical protein